ncbi:hypothetical protein I6N96_15620 [Enterococcus sp. BWM-S5]|uniref:Uncharacterized protein n=1 Tax=Enterococcus larvae TaxID=2794352 RepID=A0ABS4CM80_9ENTE|nr:hypothetical protein [Enterococcus larvae]MBP1047717.1 hypothetical protein [Enterococcus larvae]
MTESEFRRLKIDTVVKNREEEYWVVYDLDQFGGGSNVCGLRLLDSDVPKYARLSVNNYQFWQVAGKLKQV